MQMVVWVFRPTAEDLAKEWPMPANYVAAQMGEVRLRSVDDEAMSNEALFQPGWKPAAKLQAEI